MCEGPQPSPEHGTRACHRQSGVSNAKRCMRAGTAQATISGTPRWKHDRLRRDRPPPAVAFVSTFIAATQVSPAATIDCHFDFATALLALLPRIPHTMPLTRTNRHMCATADMKVIGQSGRDDRAPRTTRNSTWRQRARGRTLGVCLCQPLRWRPNTPHHREPAEHTPSPKLHRFDRACNPRRWRGAGRLVRK